MQNKPSAGPRESATSDILAAERSAVFEVARTRIEGACRQLEYLVSVYARSNVDPVRKLARIETLKSKVDYLRGLQLNANAHPWVEDD